MQKWKVTWKVYRNRQFIGWETIVVESVRKPKVGEATRTLMHPTIEKVIEVVELVS